MVGRTHGIPTVHLRMVTMNLTNETNMEYETKTLYKVFKKDWRAPHYVAADSHQEAVDIVADACEDVTHKNEFNVEYVSEVYV